MKKLFLTILFLFFIIFNVKAQLDTEHWFAPMFDRNSSNEYYSNSSRQYLHLSTNETEAFDVEVYSNNTLIATIKNLRKGNPQKISIRERYIISKDFSEPGKVITKGLYVKGGKKFFANLRFSTYNHAEILTSKGQAGIGNKFYVITTPQYHAADIINSMVGILATENNTKVKISGYHPNVRFTNISPTPQSIEITLNKGESYILEGDAYGANKDGFIGTKIEADKPISITNGNFNGQYTDNIYTVGSDIIMDQSLPVDRLGREFAIIKGNGEIGQDMEGAIIVATENNTQIYLNDEVNPITTLNEGDYYIVPDSKFANPRQGHYNLYIKTTKNVYVYQLLAGLSTSTATAGFNYIPPLNCFLPTEVGEIGRINELDGEGAYGVYNTTEAKLNFITLKEAEVRVERNNQIYNLNSTHGPFDLTGTDEWVTYSIPNIDGNISIISTKPVTAGISAGNGYAGYGGYFAGFSSVITIKRNGECLPNLTLEIEEDFDAYQWLKDGQPIAGATSKTYTPTEPGNYSVEIRNDYCTHTTAETRVVNCTVETHINNDICGAKNYTPTFSQSTQQVDLSSITIIEQPQYGRVILNNGIITYEPDVYDGSDNFTYQFCGVDSEFPDCEIVYVNLNIGTLPVNNAALKTCQENGVGVFDLTLSNIGDTTDYIVKYYPTLNDANSESNEITNPSAYSSNGGQVFAKISSNEGCHAIATIDLNFHDSPIINANNYNATHCDANFDGVIEINFAEVSASISPNYEVKYYLNEADAKAGNNNFLPNQWSYSVDTSVFARAISNEGCHTIEQIDFKIKDRLPLNQNQAEITLCDDDFDGIINVNLADYHSLFTNENVIGSYYSNLNDAQNARNPLTEINAQNGDTFYFRLENSAHCANIASLTINVNTPKASETLADQLICHDTTTILDAGAGFTSYLWSTGETTQNITAGVGTYWVKLTSDNHCPYTQFVNVNAIETPKITSIDIKDNVVSINAEGGTQPYEYSLDGGNWQTSNVFTNVRQGQHRVAVRSQNGCSPTEQDFAIISLVNLITPNGDGINDTIDYSDLRTKANAKFNIYDRYGALVFEGNNSNQFIWDGKAKGRTLPTATYWYEIEWQEPNTNTWVKTASWILLKNRD